MSEVEEVVVVSAGQSTEASTRAGGVREATFYKWKYRQYFVIVEEGDKNLKARCTLCSTSAKPLSCARNTTSNLKKTPGFSSQNGESYCHLAREYKAQEIR